MYDGSSLIELSSFHPLKVSSYFELIAIRYHETREMKNSAYLFPFFLIILDSLMAILDLFDITTLIIMLYFKSCHLLFGRLFELVFACSLLFPLIVYAFSKYPVRLFVVWNFLLSISVKFITQKWV